ncbi:hypothetical protein FB45DRAFT_752387 [Roridomyces roridus]|uniref:Uncharacterized protein n=1 Tax=Roridomyces roridus TaxID=1738132 RepID=A0AAD7BJK0_9AGAR|nr:hypothetical protein FB45DRAFT_752387 [Roridomyces roridus]
MSSSVGTAFLGDKRRRLLSSSTASNSTPPSSPPATSMSGVFSALPSPPPTAEVPPETAARAPKKTEDIPAHPPAVIDSALSLELRLRWLEAILLGVKQDATNRKVPAQGETHSLLRAAEDLQTRLNRIVNGNDGLRRFMDQYDRHAHLLTPSFALSETTQAPTFSSMSASELEAFLIEMEPDIRAAERDMQEIEVLEERGVTGAGKLGDYEALQPRLDALLKAHGEDVERAAALEKRVARLMESHATQVDALSELFVAWDDTLMDAEDKIIRLEKDRNERQRLGLE